jgi:nucleotide-binding universal stress UspA family protein
MAAFRQILCPIDFSEHARRAFDHALAIARAHHSTITVLHARPAVLPFVYGTEVPMMPSPLPTHEYDPQLLSALTRFVGGDSSVRARVEFALADGPAAAGILATAAAKNSDLIVMGTHGRSGFERLVLGSVTEKVIHQATCAVLTVPRLMAEAVPAPPVLFKRILCATDFSDASLRALDHAVSLAQDAAAHLMLVHVVEVTPAPPGESEHIAESRSLGAYVAAAAQDRAERLQRVLSDSVRSRCAADTKVAIGKASREILRLASEDRSELIVLGAHGHGVNEWLFGSAAHQIVRQAVCPVLTVR